MNKLVIAALVFFQSSIYPLSFFTAGGEQIHMEQFRGKKILLVNIATESKYAGQLGELQQLQEQFGDKLVVIAFPSNSFGHESSSSEAVQQLCRERYHASYLIAQKSAVAGSNAHALYRWLTTQSENGRLQGEVKADFQKYLIDENGNLVGVFAPGVHALDPPITGAVSASY